MRGETQQTSRRVGFGIIAIGVIAALAIVGIVAERILASRDFELEADATKAGQTAKLLESAISGTFQAAEIVADMVLFDERFQVPDGGPAMAAAANQFAGLSSNWQFIHSIGFIGADGKTRTGVLRVAGGIFEPVPHSNFANSETFLAHSQRTSLTDKVSISKAITFESGNQALILSKGLWSPTGEFEGIASVAIRSDAIEKVLIGFSSDVKGIISLMRSDGTLLLTDPFSGLIVGQAYPKSVLFSRAVKEAPSGVYTAPMTESESLRRFAYQVSPQYPLVVVIGLPVAQILSEWRRTSVINAGAALFAAALIIALSVVLAVWIRRQYAAQLQIMRSEHSLVESQRISGLGHFERDLGRPGFRWSDNMYAIHGVKMGEFEPTIHSIVGLFLPEDRNVVERATSAGWLNPHSGFLEARVRRIDGSVRHMHYEWRLVDDGDGAGGRIFGVAQDITELRMAEAGLRENEARLTDIVECSSDYIWETDAVGVFTVFTGGGVDLFHSPLGMTGLTFYVQSDGPDDLPQMEQAISQHRQFRNLLVQARATNGAVRWARVSGNPRFDAHGNFLGYRGAGSDVTEQRRQIQLLEAQRKSAALGRLAGGLAHEINNLLQPVMIYAAAGSGADGASEQVHSYFTRILKASERASSIVRNVLAFARRSPPRREDVNMLAVIRETVEFSGIAEYADVAIAIDDVSLNQIVRVDRTGMSQVILNLVTNAVEAMNRCGRISIHAEQVAITAPGDVPIELQPGVYCRLTVEDNGPGIPPENLPQIFDPFFTTKPQGEGTGLGLSVVSGLVKSWGGGIAAGNGVAGGAAFRIYMPAAVRQLQAAQ